MCILSVDWGLKMGLWKAEALLKKKLNFFKKGSLKGRSIIATIKHVFYSCVCTYMGQVCVCANV
jgi:hypothetical protein